MDEDSFVRDFNTFQGRREELVAVLVSGTNRLTLNIPGRGIARRIAALLRDGPFTDYYEFEKLLARALHPVLAGLNLNIIADIRVNRVFSDKYQFYARDINYTLASNRNLEPEALKSVILKMVERDGHFLVVKFYDLVLRLLDARLYRDLKPAELCLIEMKKNLGGDVQENSEAIVNMYNAYRETHGDAAARLLLKRAEWDQWLSDYLPTEGKPGVIGMTVDAAESADVPSWGERVARYAALIKENYLIMKEPTDEQGIRGIVQGMAVKNEKVSGAERSADIVRDVLALWVEDDALDAGMRGVLATIRDERLRLPDMHDGDVREELAREADFNGEPQQEIVEQEAIQQEAPQMEDIEHVSGEEDPAVAVANDEGSVMEPARGEDRSEAEGAGISDEEMSAILAEISDTVPERDDTSAAAADQKATEQSADDEAFLIGEDEIQEIAEEKPPHEAVEDESFLIIEEEPEDEVTDELSEEMAADKDLIEEMIAADEFVIHDELLYEDQSLQKKPKKEKKPDDEQQA